MTGTTIPHVTVSITEAIDITDVTSGTIGGDGVLDKLLSTMTEHLTAQYEKRRITGVEYATLYLGAYQTTLQQALALTAAKEIQAYEIKNLDWEAKLKEAQYSLAVKQLEAATYELSTKTPIEVSNLTKQGLSIEADIALKGTQNDTAVYVLGTQLPLEVANLTKQGNILTAEASQKAKDLEISTYQLATRLPIETANLTKQGTLLDIEVTQKAKELDIATYELSTKLPAEVASINKQTDLYERKRLTEVAQLDGTAIGATSVLGVQHSLITAQKDGFARDAEQKVAKIMLDTWVTRVNNDIGEQNNSNLLKDNNLGAVVTKMFTGIGVTTVEGPNVLAAPVITHSNTTSTGTILSWPEVAPGGDVIGFYVYKDWALFATIGLVTSHIITGLTPATTYDFKVRARDAIGGTSLFSNTRIVTTL